MKNKIFLSLILLLVVILMYYALELILAYNKKDVLRIQYLSNEKLELAIDDLSKLQIDLLIKIQDPNFFHHKGVEFKAPGSGWTTITQSITKFMYFKNFKQGLKKIKQSLIARFITNNQFSKKEQLEIFINNMWFEKDVIGLKQASYFYYHKENKQLTTDEYLSIIAMIISPKKYNILKEPVKNKKRVDRIKRYLSEDYQPTGLFDIEYDKR
jgi:membrane carboxypeptidase/penicillin-binding protein